MLLITAWLLKSIAPQPSPCPVMLAIAGMCSITLCLLTPHRATQALALACGMICGCGHAAELLGVDEMHLMNTRTI